MAIAEYGKAVQQMADMTRALLDHPDIYKLQAKATRKRCKALRKVGFSKREAIAIVAAQGVGFDTKVS